MTLCTSSTCDTTVLMEEEEDKLNGARVVTLFCLLPPSFSFQVSVIVVVAAAAGFENQL